MHGQASAGASQRDAEKLLALFGPPLFDALCDPDSQTRHRAARALCAMAAAEPAAVETLTEGLFDWLASGDAPPSVARTVATLAASHPNAVRTTLEAKDATEDLIDSLERIDGWNFHHAPDEGPTEPTLTTADGGTDPGQLVHDVVAETDRSPTVHTRSDQTAADAPDILPPDDPDDAAPHRPDPAAVGRRKRLEKVESSRLYRAIELYSRFDELSVLEPEQALRYGSAVRSHATVGDEELGLAVRLIELPEDSETRTQFAAGVAEQLAAWEGITDHPGVLTVHDWGDQPRPWLATPYVNGTLADRGRIGLSRALAEAVHLARALGHCHRNGVIHGGIDPHSIVYPEATLDGLPKPRLDNVGLFQEAATHLSPRTYLDPRYAAPEYFDSDCGRVDQTTDVYQLGASLYRLFTGRAPYTGEKDAVRRAVLHDQPPAPSEVADLPPSLDPVFEKALETRKLTRYESIAALRADLTAVGKRME
jgi:hypothetical protein